MFLLIGLWTCSELQLIPSDINYKYTEMRTEMMTGTDPRGDFLYRLSQFYEF